MSILEITLNITYHVSAYNEIDKSDYMSRSFLDKDLAIKYAKEIISKDPNYHPTVTKEITMEPISYEVIF